jgi:hypothetical protein
MNEHEKAQYVINKDFNELLDLAHQIGRDLDRALNELDEVATKVATLRTRLANLRG